MKKKKNIDGDNDNDDTNEPLFAAFPRDVANPRPNIDTKEVP